MRQQETHSGYQLVRPAKNQPAEASRAIQLKITSLQRDRLACLKFADGELGEETVYVALPWWLRRTPHHGSLRLLITYLYLSNSRRRAILSTEEEQIEIIVPSYNFNDFIYAVPVDHTDVNGPDLEELKLLDMNVDGRVWAKE